MLTLTQFAHILFVLATLQLFYSCLFDALKEPGETVLERIIRFFDRQTAVVTQLVIMSVPTGLLIIHPADHIPITGIGQWFENLLHTIMVFVSIDMLLKLLAAFYAEHPFTQKVGSRVVFSQLVLLLITVLYFAR